MKKILFLNPKKNCMKKAKFLFLILLTFLTLATYSQFVKGVVLDASNGMTIPGATVYLKGTNTGTISDIDGNFRLKAQPGVYKLVISVVGYKTFMKDIAIEQGLELDLGNIEMEVDAIGIEEVKVIASFAQDRKTPVSLSTIEPTVITEKLGTKEYPEILKTTPSVYATKQGGGYGDSRINVRGFSSENVGVLINGMPVNDMENGWVYWSNWAGLSDVTRTIQVQRGLGAAKVAISSVGGTINIITKTTDVEQGGTVSYSIGNDGYEKKAFSLSTGLTASGWAMTVLGSNTKGNGYVKGTNFEAWSYFVNVSKQLNKKNQISFTLIGAPQWHNQRSNRQLIETYRKSPDGIRFNNMYGYYNGQILSTAYAYNYYHKPVAMINHYWRITDKSSLNTVVYTSWGRGGGRRADGTTTYITFDNSTGLPYSNTILTIDGLIDWDSVMRLNAASLTGSKVILSNAVNSHDWYGLLSTYNNQINNFYITLGYDARFYKGYHYKEIYDLLGGRYFLDANDKNRDPNKPLYKGDKIGYYNLGLVLWNGLFGQVEYSTADFTAFISGAGSYTQYSRVDFFQYTPESKVEVRPGDTVVGQQTPWVPFFSYSVKGGANYNINADLNVFINAGYFTRPPFFKYVFKNNTNLINDDVKLEKVWTVEGGIGYKTRRIKLNLYGYYTNWIDKTLTVTMGGVFANIPGLNANHKGIELTAKIKPISKVEIGLMGSLGDWRWTDNVVADIYDDNQQFIGQFNVYAKNLHVSDAAQTSAAVTFDWEVLPKLKVGLDWTYFDRIYAQFNVENRTKPNDTTDAWRMPSYNLLDFSARYNFNIGPFEASLIGNVDNVLNAQYISDARDGVNHDAATATVYYGLGRTWVVTLRVKF